MGQGRKMKNFVKKGGYYAPCILYLPRKQGTLAVELRFSVSAEGQMDYETGGKSHEENRNILYAVDKFAGSIAWSLDIRDYLDEEEAEAAVYAAPPLMLNGEILLAFSNGKVLKIDARQGVVTAKTELGIDISNGLIAAQQKVIAVSDDAEVSVFE